MKTFFYKQLYEFYIYYTNIVIVFSCFTITTTFHIGTYYFLMYYLPTQLSFYVHCSIVQLIICHSIDKFYVMTLGWFSLKGSKYRMTKIYFWL